MFLEFNLPNLIENKRNPHNIAAGRLFDIVNSTNDNISYYDINKYGKVSCNDWIFINYTLLPYNITDEKYGFSFYYDGDLDGSISEEIFEEIGSAKIEEQ